MPKRSAKLSGRKNADPAWLLRDTSCRRVSSVCTHDEGAACGFLPAWHLRGKVVIGCLELYRPLPFDSKDSRYASCILSSAIEEKPRISSHVRFPCDFPFPCEIQHESTNKNSNAPTARYGNSLLFCIRLCFRSKGFIGSYGCGS